MNVIDCSVSDVKLIEPTVYGDHRGSFFESWNDQAFRKLVDDIGFVQDNHSVSALNTLRGLHYQTKHTQGKLVRVIRGEVFDVAVDLRKASDSFGKHVGVVLSQSNKRLFWIPPGFAHGFLALTDEVEFLYKCTDYYAPEYERTILWNDADIGIEWPLAADNPPILSGKDQLGVAFRDAEYL